MNLGIVEVSTKAAPAIENTRANRALNILRSAICSATAKKNAAKHETINKSMPKSYYMPG